MFDDSSKIETEWKGQGQEAEGQLAAASHRPKV